LKGVVKFLTKNADENFTNRAHILKESNMKHIVLMVCLCFFYACDNSEFSGTPATSSAPAYQSEEQVAATETFTEVEDLENKECLLATNGDAKSVVSISQGNVDLSKITPNSVLLLEVQGQAQIDLTSAQISSLKGICIFSAGGASIQLDLNATVLAMYYYSRGNSVSKLNFGSTGTLAKLATDVSGGSQLELTGQKLACDTLKLPYGGSSRITCNGTNL